MKNCPLCGEGTLYEKRAKTVTYKDHKKTINQIANYCDACGESFLSSKDIKSTWKEINDFKREVDHLLNSSQIKHIRKKRGLTQKDASEILGGGINAFSRYERGEVIQSPSTDIVLRLLDQGVVTVEQLKSIRCVTN